jgi:hypothetical protein
MGSDEVDQEVTADRQGDAVPGLEEPDQTWQYREIAEGAGKVRALYAERALRLHRDSVLGILLREAEALNRDWESGRSGTGDIRRLVSAGHANRIIHVLDQVGCEPGAEEALRRIAGNVDLAGRQQSQGKDALWELELFVNCRTRGVEVAIVDPPDLVLRLSLGELGVACKKIYSENGVEAQIRKGGKQLAPYKGVGLIALNLDDLLPADAILRAENIDGAGKILAATIDQFVDRHGRVLQRAVLERRCDGFLLSAHTQADIVGSRVRFNNYSHTTVWTVETAATESRARIEEFGRLMGARELALGPAAASTPDGVDHQRLP